jgi:aldehyde:ferredoxin oxidoreductase
MVKAYLDGLYTLRGWDVTTGVPTRAKLEELDLKDVADALKV